MKTALLLPLALSSGLSLVALGYGIARAGEVSEAWKLSHGCQAVAWTKNMPDANGMIFIEEGSVDYLCAGGRLVR